MTDTFQPIGEAARRVVGRLAAAQRIEPGLYLDMHPADYFADPCPSPSLTQSIAKTLLEHSPAHARLEHPRLNPDFEPSDPKKYDVGNIAHALLLGRGRDLVVIAGDDWVSDRKAKSEAREAALAEGKLAVLSRDFDIGHEMVIAARRQIEDVGFEAPWPSAERSTGDGEVVIAWNEGSIWFRSMIDWLTSDRRLVFDYKTTGTSAAPHAVARRVPDGGWDIQAAMHERGLNAIFPHDAGRRQHVFLCQEDYPPYALTAVRLPEAALTIGRKKLAVASSIWAEAFMADAWPAYPMEVLVPEYPEWEERRWLDRELGEFAGVAGRRPSAMLTSLMGG
jgi:hypothetical protein